MDYCSKCGRLTKGHPLPWGQDCVQAPLASQDTHPLADRASESDAFEDIDKRYFQDFGVKPPGFIQPADFSPGPDIETQAAALPRDTPDRDVRQKEKASNANGSDTSGKMMDSDRKSVMEEMDSMQKCLRFLTGEVGKLSLTVQSLIERTSKQDNGVHQPSAYSQSASASYQSVSAPSAHQASSFPTAALQQPSLHPTSLAGIAPPTQPSSDIVFGNAVVPRDVAASALQGTYADLSKFLIVPDPVAEQETLTLRNGKLSINKKMAGRPINSYQQWLSAWANYEELLIRYLPSEYDLYRRCNEYRRFIHACQMKFVWPAVHSYDIHFRMVLAESRSIAFDTMDVKIYAMTFDPDQLRKDVPRCYRCKSFDHRVTECPFPQAPALEKAEKTEKADKRKNEICFNFNAGRCSFTKCPRQHVCKHCKGPSPAISCACKATS